MLFNINCSPFIRSICTISKSVQEYLFSIVFIIYIPGGSLWKGLFKLGGSVDSAVVIVLTILYFCVWPIHSYTKEAETPLNITQFRRLQGDHCLLHTASSCMMQHPSVTYKTQDIFPWTYWYTVHLQGISDHCNPAAD